MLCIQEDQKYAANDWKSNYIFQYLLTTLSKILQLEY